MNFNWKQLDWKAYAIAIVAAFFIKKLVFRPKRINYKGKVVVITGASSGIGEQLALQYAKKGAKLVLAARRVDRLNALIDKCNSLGGETIAVPTDVSNQADCKNLIEATIQKFKTIDLLLLNAGQGCLFKFAEVTDLKAYKETMDINYWGCVYLTLYALNDLRKAKGQIVVISSLASKYPSPRRTGYAPTKAAVNAFFNNLHMEEPDIGVTIVCPGFVVTELHDKAHSATAIQRETSSFMTAEKCAQITIDAASTRKREEVMTLLGKIGKYVTVFAPGLADYVAKLKAESAIKK